MNVVLTTPRKLLTADLWSRQFCFWIRGPEPKCCNNWGHVNIAHLYPLSTKGHPDQDASSVRFKADIKHTDLVFLNPYVSINEPKYV